MNIIKESFSKDIIKKVKETNRDDIKKKMDITGLMNLDTFANIISKESEKYFDISESDTFDGHVIRFCIFSGEDIFLIGRIIFVKENQYENGQKPFFYVNADIVGDNSLSKNKDMMYIEGANILKTQKYITVNCITQDYGEFPYAISSDNLVPLKSFIKELRKWKDKILLKYQSLMMFNDDGNRRNKLIDYIVEYAVDNLFFEKKNIDYYTYLTTNVQESINRKYGDLINKWRVFKDLPKYKDLSMYHVMNEFIKYASNNEISYELKHFYLGENLIEYTISTQDSSKKCKKTHNLELCEGWHSCKDKYDLDYSPNKDIFEDIVLNDLNSMLIEYNIGK